MDKYKVNQKTTCANGTSLKGFIETTYDEIVNLFGEPLAGSADGKTTCEWIIEFENGIIATIHDWKVRVTPKEIYSWSIGGHSYKALELLEQIMNVKPKPLYF